MDQRNTISKILCDIDIVDIVSQFVALRQVGEDYIGVCPFHIGHNESLVVSSHRQVYYCSECDKGGGVVDFVMNVLHLSYEEALVWLALRQTNLDIDPHTLLPSDMCNISVFEANKYAEQYFIDTLNTSEEGQAVGWSYFSEHRRFSDEIIHTFGLGYDVDTPLDSFFCSLPAGKFSDELLYRSYLIFSKNHVGPFHGRVVFPVYNVAGDVIAFSARTLKSKEDVGEANYRKYVNTGYPETTEGFTPSVYVKGDNLFGLYQAKESIIATGFCVLVEGNADVVSMHCHGYTNCVASLGTALTANQVHLLRCFTKQVCLMYDGDAAGRKAAHKAIKLLVEGGLRVSVVKLPEGEDPDTISQNKTFEELSTFINDHTYNIVDFICSIYENTMKDDDEEYFRVIQDIELIISTVKDVEWKNELLEACKKWSLQIGISTKVLLQAIDDFTKQRNNKNVVETAVAHLPKENAKIDTFRPLTQQESNLLKYLLWHYNYPIFSDNDAEVTVAEYLQQNLDNLEQGILLSIEQLVEKQQILSDEITALEQQETADPLLNQQKKEKKQLLQTVKQIENIYRSTLFRSDSCFGLIYNTLKVYGQQFDQPVLLMVNDSDEKIHNIVRMLCVDKTVVSKFFTKIRNVENVSEEFRQRMIEKARRHQVDDNHADILQNVSTVLSEFVCAMYNNQLKALQKLMQHCPDVAYRIIQENHVAINQQRI
ncbi:MAG: DNA primase, partial [Bacteroidales bacterium]|nr:DNA primase [Bacteroidales bacterium]